MAITVKITDTKQIEKIETLRGELPKKEFINRLIRVGLRVAEDEIEKFKSGNAIRFAATKQEFKDLDVTAITAALKNNDPEHPVKKEVSRLVNNYTTQRMTYAKENGNMLPKSLRIGAKASVEKIAFQITIEALKNSTSSIQKVAEPEILT